MGGDLRSSKYSGAFEFLGEETLALLKMKMLLVSVEGPPEDPWPIPLSFTAESEGPSGPEHASQFPKRCFVNKI